MKLGLELHKDELDQLPAGARMILAAACTERHSVNYHAFAGGTGSRRSKQFDAILDAIWRDIGYDKLSTDQLEKLEFRAERLIPERGPPEPRPYAAYAQLAAEALIISCIAARLHGDSTHVIYIAKKAFSAIWSFLPEVYSTWRTANGFLAPDAEEKFAAHPLTRDEHLRQERDLNDVKRMVRERCSIIDIVENLEKRSKAVALFSIGSGDNALKCRI